MFLDSVVDSAKLRQFLEILKEIVYNCYEEPAFRAKIMQRCTANDDENIQLRLVFLVSPGPVLPTKDCKRC